MATLLVSFISDQTIPNVQLINEFGNDIDKYLFISTKGMEIKGVRDWVINSCNIKTEQITQPIEVNQFSFVEIEANLRTFDFKKFKKIIVNLTGGTKVMTLAAFDFFSQMKVEIYYVTGDNDEYIQLIPKKSILKLKSRISLAQYLESYGFKITKSDSFASLVNKSDAIYTAFCSGNFAPATSVLSELQSKRKKGIKDISLVDGLFDFLNKIGFTPQEQNKLSKMETQFLTGEWFELYIAKQIKEELKLDDSQIDTGFHLEKKLNSENNKNSLEELIGNPKLLEKIRVPNNEIDIMFIYQNQLYYIECKTSIITQEKKMDKNKNEIWKDKSILGETIYKSDSLKSKFGLFAKSYIITLTSIKDYLSQFSGKEADDKSLMFIENINRLNLSDIKLIDKSLLTSSQSIKSLLNLK